MELFEANAIGNVIEGQCIFWRRCYRMYCVKSIGYVLSVWKTIIIYYTASVLCDDFYDIINKHYNEIDFDIIYDIMVHIFLKYNKCNPNKCDKIDRNSRIRNDKEYNIENNKQLTTIQILDKL